MFCWLMKLKTRNLYKIHWGIKYVGLGDDDDDDDYEEV